MRFSDEFIQRVLEANNIVDFISQHTQLKPSGGGLMGRCPFPDHQEKTASFSVSETKQVYHCFGCHKSGNLFSFLRDFQGMSFPEAIEYLANRANIQMPEMDIKTSTEEDRIAKKKKEMTSANRLALKFFIEELAKLPPTHYCHQYIEKRGLTKQTLETFQIGLAPKEWDGLTQYLHKNNISESLAEEARLIVSRKEGKSGYFDMFRDRLMFPIFNTMGEPVAFGGRVLNPADNPKYLNSPETLVFEKKKILYGLHKTAGSIRSEDCAIVVEGYMDAVSLYQSGIQNVAAVMSSSLTVEQCRLIKRMTRNVIMLLDGDDAGIDGAERSLPILLHGELFAKAVILPNKMDPDDFVKANGVSALKSLLENAQDLILVVVERWAEGFKGNPSDRVKLVDKIRPVLSMVADARLRELYVREISDRLGVTPNWLLQNLKSNPQTRVNQSEAPVVSNLQEESRNLVISKAPTAELTVMQLALKSRANFEIFSAEVPMESFTDPVIKKILERAKESYGHDPQKFDKFTSLLISKVDKPELLFHKQHEHLSATSFDEEKETKLLRDAMRRVRENNLREQVKQIQKDLAVDASPEKMERLMLIQKEILLLNKG